MKLKKYENFINENIQDTPEEYVKTALLQIKKKIEDIFQKNEDSGEVGIDGARRRWDEKSKDKNKLSFKDLKVKLESSELSTFSSLNDNVVIKFTDESFVYDLSIFIPLEYGVPKDKNKDFSSDDIKECSCKFKKYDLDTFDLVGQIGPKKVKISDIDEDFLVDLKIELDDKFGEEEELEIETNDE